MIKKAETFRYRTKSLQIDMIVFAPESGRAPAITWVRGGKGLNLSELQAAVSELGVQALGNPVDSVDTSTKKETGILS